MRKGLVLLRKMGIAVLIVALASAWLLPGALAENDILGSFSSMLSGLLGDDADDSKEAEGADEEPTDFCDAMDSYEAFFDEYVEFMKNFDESDPGDLSVLADYTSMMAKYTETMEKLDAIDEDELTDEEMAYYIDVMARINKKLLELS